MDIYKHIYIATNDFDEDISYLQNKLSNLSNIDHFITVSGGWFFLLSSISSSNILKNIVIYDINPNMLYIYNLIYHIFIISPNINSFLSNIFCRKVNDYHIFKSNQDIIDYMNIDYDINIYNNVKKQLKKYGLNGKLALLIYKTIIKKHILNLTKDHIDTNTVPSYYYNKNNFKIFNKKLHTTQSINNSSHYITTFYVNILEPFITNESYNNVRNHLLISNVSFRLFDLNILSSNNFINLLNKISKNTSNDNICIYIDGIDMDYFTYLNMNRSNLFKIFQTIIDKYNLNKFYILSTKSGINIIDKKEIKYDDYYIKTKNIEIKDKPLIENYKSIEYTKYDKEYIEKLNNDLSYNLIKSYRYNNLYKIFRSLPKPCNPHIHFSTIVSYNKILNILHSINNNYPDIYIKFNKNKIYLGFENDEINKNNSELYNKDKHYKQIIRYIQDHNNINKFDKINMIGDLFYNIIKYKKFYIEYYLPNIINMMNKHNIYYMNIRLLLGTLFDIDKTNNKRIYLSYIDELDLLYQYRDKFNLIISFSKCKDHQIIINNITNICNLINNNNKYREIIIGFDLLGDEDLCNEISNLINPLLDIKHKYNIDYYIHAGEFIKSIKSLNNLNNVFKLQPKRIGHASYFIINNDMNYNNNNNILLELCPISNYFYHQTIYNNNKFINLLDYIVIGSDDDNKLLSNLSIDYMFLYFYYKINIQQIKQLLLNSLKCISQNIIDKYDLLNKFNNDFINISSNFS